VSRRVDLLESVISRACETLLWGSKKRRFVSKCITFFSNGLCLPNFRESASVVNVMGSACQFPRHCLHLFVSAKRYIADGRGENNLHARQMTCGMNGIDTQDTKIYSPTVTTNIVVRTRKARKAPMERNVASKNNSSSRSLSGELSLCDASVIRHVFSFREHHHLLTLWFPSASLVFSAFPDPGDYSIAHEGGRKKQRARDVRMGGCWATVDLGQKVSFCRGLRPARDYDLTENRIKNSKILTEF
jgi:hypothetical protein